MRVERYDEAEWTERIEKAILAWAKRYSWGAEAWKNDGENAELFRLADLIREVRKGE